jgi:hypothetical protein
MRLVEGTATLDVVQLLRELGVGIAGGSAGAHTWLLRAPDGSSYEVTPTAPVTRLDAHLVRNHVDHHGPGRGILLIGGTATEGVVQRARRGEIDILTAEPLRLIRDGITYQAAEDPSSQRTGGPSKRPAWTRWAVERYLVLAAEPARQAEIADAVGTTQQSVSNAARHLGDLVTDHGAGLITTNRPQLLEHWREEYPGPGGHEFGWYGLDPVTEQVSRATEASGRLGARPLVSGDVAADRISPWKVPARGRLYVESPVDLSEDGFVPAPLEEASLVTCVPRDPSLWRLLDLTPAEDETADAALVYWELATSADLDSDAAAARLAAFITRQKA